MASVFDHYGSHDDCKDGGRGWIFESTSALTEKNPNKFKLINSEFPCLYSFLLHPVHAHWLWFAPGGASADQRWSRKLENFSPSSGLQFSN